MTKDKSEALEMLEFVANRFDTSPWTFSHDIGDLKHIRYRHDYTGYNAWWRRALRAFSPREWFSWGHIDKAVFGSWWRKAHPRSVLAHIRVNLMKKSHLPDGIVLGPGVITHWQEDGVFISLMNPDVATAILDFIKDRPEDKHAIRMREAIEAAHERNEKQGEVND